MTDTRGILKGLDKRADIKFDRNVLMDIIGQFTAHANQPETPEQIEHFVKAAIEVDDFYRICILNLVYLLDMELQTKDPRRTPSINLMVDYLRDRQTVKTKVFFHQLTLLKYSEVIKNAFYTKLETETQRLQFLLFFWSQDVEQFKNNVMRQKSTPINDLMQIYHDIKTVFKDFFQYTPAYTDYIKFIESNIPTIYVQFIEAISTKSQQNNYALLEPQKRYALLNNLIGEEVVRFLKAQADLNIANLDRIVVDATDCGRFDLVTETFQFKENYIPADTKPNPWEIPRITSTDLSFTQNLRSATLANAQAIEDAGFYFSEEDDIAPPKPPVRRS